MPRPRSDLERHCNTPRPCLHTRGRLQTAFLAMTLTQAFSHQEQARS